MLRRLRMTAGGLVAAVAVAAAVAWWPRVGSSPAQRPPSAAAAPGGTIAASVRAFADARFSRRQGPPDEIVELAAGTIDVDVVHLPPGARFRVVALGGEVEVRGTSFRVSAPSGRLEEVHVWRGHVEVRSAAGGVTHLATGDSWAASPAVATSAGETIAALLPTTGPALEPPRAPRPASDRARARARLRDGAGSPARRLPPTEAPSAATSASFHRGWSLLRAGDALAAAEAFAEVEDAARGMSLEADALYWRAVALSRGGQRRAARDLLELFSRRFPTSPQAGEAAVALGFLLLDLGQPTEARQAFTRAERDPSERVRANARLGLERISR